MRQDYQKLYFIECATKQMEIVQRVSFMVWEITDVHHRNAFIVRFGRLHNEPLYTNANFNDEEINALLGGIVCHYRRNTVSNKKMNGILKAISILNGFDNFNAHVNRFYNI